jgi:hypothetical protein
MQKVSKDNSAKRLNGKGDSKDKAKIFKVEGQR